MRITDHKTRDVFDRYHILSTDDVSDAMRKLETASLANGATLAQIDARNGRLLRASNS
jgi:hypothetical protein